jgi:hypothetical protein
MRGEIVLRPDLDGLRVKLNFVNGGELYLMDQGKARHIDFETYSYVFMDWDGIWEIDAHSDIEFGSPLKNAMMFRWGGAIYLTDGGDAHTSDSRHVADPQRMVRYHFKRDNLLTPSMDPTLDGRKPGPEIKWVPRFNGNRVAPRNDPGLYLIDQGRKRRIADWATNVSLFGGGDGVQSVANLDDVEAGPDIATGTRLIKGDRRPEIYLHDADRKRRIVDDNTLKYYGFVGGAVITLSEWDITEIPSGAAIQWPDANIG